MSGKKNYPYTWRIEGPPKNKITLAIGDIDYQADPTDTASDYKFLERILISFAEQIREEGNEIEEFNYHET